MVELVVCHAKLQVFHIIKHSNSLSISNWVPEDCDRFEEKVHMTSGCMVYSRA